MSFDVNQFVRQQLDGFRRRLLDLTGRNPLLSFKHAARASRYVRLIDELPDVVYGKLESGNPLKFRSLGEPVDEPADEKTIVFRRALEAAKLEDEQYLRGLAEAADQEAGEKFIEQLEQELRVRLREQLGMSPRKATSGVSPTEAARRRGLNPAFDLPASAGADVAAKHNDAYLQTLLFDEAMDATLNRMRDNVRLSVEELGVNPLYCVFGFLEWYEDSASSEPRLAPLLVYPLELQREAVRGRYVFSVRSTGDGGMENVALVERLKGFGVALRPYPRDEADTPEAYFADVAAAIEPQKHWRVKRWLTVGLLGFSRAAMYQDLDPAGPLFSQATNSAAPLHRILAGGGSTNGGGGEPHSLDGGPVEQHSADSPRHDLEMVLVSEADSSQREVICDVLSGRSVVVEGPPGTGKSQTITNLIAALLEAGKTVLFVAEKMAALNVVKSRLDAASLGEFCLECHSTKGSRAEVYSALKRRLELLGDSRAETAYNEAEARLRALRELLSERVSALAAPAGSLGVTTQELFWRINSVRAAAAALPDAFDNLYFAQAGCVSEAEVGRLVATAARFAEHRAAVLRRYGSFQQHPWHGIDVVDLDPFRAGDATRKMQALADASRSSLEVLRELAALTSVRFDRAVDLLAVAQFSDASGLPEFADDRLIAQLRDPNSLGLTEQFMRDVAECDLLGAAIERRLESGVVVDDPFISTLEALIEAARAAGLESVTLADFKVHGERAIQEASAWAKIQQFSDRLAERCGMSSSPNPESERLLVTVVKTAAAVDPSVADGRTPALMAIGATNTLRRAKAVAHELVERRSSLDRKFVVNSITDPVAVRGHAAELRKTSALSVFNSDWRKARAVYRGLCRAPRRASGPEMAEALERLADLVTDLATFRVDRQLQDTLGHEFRGVDTDFDRYQRVATWADAIREALPDESAVAGQLQKMLLSAPSDRLRVIGAARQDRTFAHFERFAGRHQPGGIAAVAAARRKRAEVVRAACSVAARSKLQPTVKLSDLGQLLTDCRQYHRLSDGIANSQAIARLIGSEPPFAPLELKRLGESASYLRSVLSLAADDRLKEWLFQAHARSRADQLRPLAMRAREAHARFERAASELRGVVSVNDAEWLGETVGQASIEQLAEHAARCSSDPDGLSMLIEDSRLLSDVTTLGLGPLVEVFDAARASLKDFPLAAKKLVYESLGRSRIAETPVLGRFSGERHECERTEFRELDRKLQHLKQRVLAARLSRRPVDAGCGVGPRGAWTGKALIDNEVAKQRRHISVRSLLDRAGAAVQQLAPCFLMSPLSVAQVLPSTMTFDVVIMDEASQVRPEEALGAIARGRQIVIVGDPKQLPPTAFFSASDSDVASDDPSDDDTLDESILDRGLGVLNPARRLKWHYRSRHGSLIAFSNQAFYDSELVVFPSPHVESPDYGVRLEYLPEARYRDSLNHIEAERIANSAVAYAKLHPNRSLGVVALNQRQAELISRMVDQMAVDDEEFEAWRKRSETSLEPFFVKNLENVQGDERDAIMISTVYGKDEAGNFYQRFGPINGAGGHRRLNVLFTRAKCQIVVFSSMNAADIAVHETSSKGVRALKGFLEFARSGALDMPTLTGREPDSDFERAVAGILRSEGFDVVPQVGVAGYYIDLGVRHPRRQGLFALGVECDGAMYHSSKSARDRDRLRQEVLERLNWRIHRIWSLDWFRNPAKEAERLKKAMHDAVREIDAVAE